MSGDLRRWLNRIAFHGGRLTALLALFGFLASTVQTGFGCCSRSTEWPPGIATGVAHASTGEAVVLVGAADRVQVYDGDWRFLRGWNVGEHGKFGGFHLSEGDVIKVYAPGRRISYDLDGRILDSTPLRAAPRPPRSLLTWVPGSAWYWFLLSPVPCLLLFFFGGAMAELADRDRPGSKRPRE